MDVLYLQLVGTFELFCYNLQVLLTSPETSHGPESRYPRDIPQALTPTENLLLLLDDVLGPSRFIDQRRSPATTI